jgi:hypothetical protein
MKGLKFFVFFTVLVFISSCDDDTIPKADISEVDIQPLVIDRMELDLFSVTPENINQKTQEMEAKYGNFYSTFIKSIINNGGLKDTSYAQRLLQFTTDRDMKEVFENCKQSYAQVNDLETDFTEAFKYYTHYFPKKEIPKVITMMSGFNFNVVNADSTIAIGLEMYLGSNNKFYQMLQMPRYKSLFMNKENIVPDAVRVWMLTEFPYNMDKTDLLSEMIYMGKIMYLTDALLPEVHDSLKIQYTNKQLNYCQNNEFNIWSYFAAQKLLYTTDQAEIMKYTADGPFTTAFSKESAPRIGYWVGWQIVRQYMKNNKATTLEELMGMTDAQIILAKSKYKPKK